MCADSSTNTERSPPPPNKKCLWSCVNMSHITKLFYYERNLYSKYSIVYYSVRKYTRIGTTQNQHKILNHFSLSKNLPKITIFATPDVSKFRSSGTNQRGQTTDGYCNLYTELVFQPIQWKRTKPNQQKQLPGKIVVSSGAWKLRSIVMQWLGLEALETVVVGTGLDIYFW